MTANLDNCFDLSVQIVHQIHREALAKFGGLRGLRDENFIISTVLGFGGKSPYADTIEIAAAYLFYPCRNHPFHDGNKRTAMMAAIVVLRLNGSETKHD